MSFYPGGVHAPSAHQDGEGGVVLIHNMHSSKRTPGWRGITTLPRQLTLVKDDTIAIKPYGDYQSLRYAHKRIDNLHLPANKEITLNNIRGNTMEIIAEIDVKESQMVELNVLSSPDKEEYTSIKFFKDKGLSLVRTNPKLKGENWSLISLETAYSSILPDVESRAPEILPLYFKDGETLKLNIFIDKSVIEVFVNDRQVLSTRVYPGLTNSLGVTLRAQGSEATLKSLDAWQMKSIYE